MRTLSVCLRPAMPACPYLVVIDWRVKKKKMVASEFSCHGNTEAQLEVGTCTCRHRGAWLYYFGTQVKGMVHPKILFYSTFTYHNVVSNCIFLWIYFRWMQRESFLNNILILFMLLKKRRLKLSNLKNSAKKNSIKLAHLYYSLKNLIHLN